MAARFESVFDGLDARDLPYVFEKSLTDDEERSVQRMLELRRGWCVVDLPHEFGCLIVPMAKVGSRSL